jgi:hypothetical protein
LVVAKPTTSRHAKGRKNTSFSDLVVAKPTTSRYAEGRKKYKFKEREERKHAFRQQHLRFGCGKANNVKVCRGEKKQTNTSFKRREERELEEEKENVEQAEERRCSERTDDDSYQHSL